MTGRLERVPIWLGCVALCFLPGAVGVVARPGAWYQGLVKPGLTPPAWIFPVAWTALYLAMGVALSLFLDAPGRNAPRAAIALFAGQLLLNGLWSWLFFGLHRPGLALVEICLLWLSILGSLIAFWRRRPAAGALLAPYLAWVGFAGYLNLELWRLNR
jgi:tryptophan-rich sensory protein